MLHHRYQQDPFRGIYSKQGSITAKCNPPRHSLTDLPRISSSLLAAAPQGTGDALSMSDRHLGQGSGLRAELALSILRHRALGPDSLLKPTGIFKSKGKHLNCCLTQPNTTNCWALSVEFFCPILTSVASFFSCSNSSNLNKKKNYLK